MATSSMNMRRLRSGDIGSINAWLPSRRSTAHQRGAVSMRRVGQVRSGRSTPNCSWYDAYRWNGMRLARWRAIGFSEAGCADFAAATSDIAGVLLRQEESWGAPSGDWAIGFGAAIGRRDSAP